MLDGTGDDFDGQRRLAGLPLAATVLLAMLMSYSMILIHCGVPWQFAVAVPVSLATATVHLVRQMYAAHSDRRPPHAPTARLAVRGEGVQTGSSDSAR